MDITIQGDFKSGKEMMKSERAERMKRINRLERDHKKLTRPPNEEIKELKALRKSIPFFSVSRTLPAEYQGIVVNGKLLHAFLKKLKRYEVVISVQHGALYLDYENRNSKGELELRDISSYFKDFPDVPKLEVSFDFLQ